jgi:hypothetical protein
MGRQPRHRSDVHPHQPHQAQSPPPNDAVDLLAQWMHRKNQTGTGSTDVQVNDLRFAFYGRTSTLRHQDRVSSQGWQRDMANDLIAGHGQMVAAHFDVGTSRRSPWPQRTQRRG